MTKLSITGITGLALAATLVWAAGTSAVDKANQALGAASLNSIQYSGTGKAGTLGQSLTPTSAWPTLNITTYSKTIDFPSQSSREEMTRVQEEPPAQGGGAPFAGEQKQVNLSSGQYAWNQPGAQPQPAAAAADERQLQIWLTPQGFVKGASANHGVEKKVKGGTEVSYTVNGKFKVSGVIDSQGLVTKTETWLPNPVLGDMLVETDYADYKDFGGIKFPAHIVQKQGGYPVLDLTVTKVQPNVSGAALTVPDAVRNATAPPVQVTSQKLADGVWFLAGGTHNSVLVEYKDYLAVVEAPNNEERSLAVIAEVKKLVPGKPIKYLINTHHHFDHSSGVRTYVAEGATVITSAGNKAYYEQAWKAPRTLAPDKLAQNPKKASFIEVKDKYVLTDGSRTLELYMNHGDTHNATILMGYLPKEKILIEADDFTPPAPNGPALVPLAMGFGNNLYNNVRKLNLDVDTIAPLHGRVVAFSEFPKALGKS
jgi:glyoxylase-like metal-dependent hydrolase (beta-lactamase superfamily II)